MWKQYGEASVACIQEDPYCLCGPRRSTSAFDIADAIAESMEKPRDRPRPGPGGHPRRAAPQPGTTATPACPWTGSLPPPPKSSAWGPDAVQDGIYTLCEGFHWRRRIDGQEFLFLQKQHASESYIAARMLAMLSMAPNAIPGAEAKIAAIEREQGIRYAQKQKEAIQHALEQGILILTGGPGTGKTTTLNAIIRLLQEAGERVFLAAAHRPRRQAHERGHRRGGQDHPPPASGGLGREGQPRVYPQRAPIPLECDCLVVDKLSMIKHLLRL